MTQVIQAKEMLEEMGISTDIWSVTSYIELQREALQKERDALLSASDDKEDCFIETLLEKEEGVFVSVSDYVKSLGMGIAKWMKHPYAVLGTDGYGVSESRGTLRDHFEISPKYIALAALQLLRQEGTVKPKEIADFMKQQDINADKINPAYH